MKKILTLLIVLIVVTTGCSNDGFNIKNIDKSAENTKDELDINEQIKNAKCITEYSNEATIDDFDTVKIGKYEQDGNIDNGPEDIEWIILEKENEQAKLISKYILDNVTYDEKSYKWESSNIRKWLNKTFYDMAFTGSDNIVSYCTIPRKNYEDSVYDKVFILNDDIEKKIFKKRDFFCIDSDVTNYAKNIDNHGEKIEVRMINGKEYASYSTMIIGSSYGNDVLNVYPLEGLVCAEGLCNYHIGVRPVIVVQYEKNIINTKKSTLKELIIKNNTCDLEKLNMELKTIGTANTIYDCIFNDLNIKSPIVKMGKFYKYANNENDDIEWIILFKDEQNKKALLLSKYVINNMCFNDFLENTLCWKNSSLREYLNDTFFNNAFNEKEQEIIITTNNENFANRSIGVGPVTESINYGNITSDKIFILSLEDLYMYFNHSWHEDDINIIAKPTKYAKNILNNGIQLTLDSLNNQCNYWLRDMGTNDCFASIVTYDGWEDEKGTLVNSCDIGVRPAMWVKYE